MIHRHLFSSRPAHPRAVIHALRATALGVAVLVATVTTLAQSAAPAATRSFLWKATAKQGGGQVYLMGSVHLLTKDYYPLNAGIEAAFKESDLLVEEVDFGEMLAPASQLKLLNHSMLPGTQSLDTVLTPQTRDAVAARVSKNGMPFEPLKRFKPWALALMLLGLEWQKAGFEPDLGLDRHFYERAKADRKQLKALETLDFQISRFDELTMPQQDRLLSQTLSELDTQMAAVTALADSWRSGDVATIERLVLKDVMTDRQMYERILVERNRLWFPTIEALFARPTPAFVVVGAAHLVGPDGLLAMLKSRGYAVEQR